MLNVNAKSMWNMTKDYQQHCKSNYPWHHTGK